MSLVVFKYLRGNWNWESDGYLYCIAIMLSICSEFSFCVNRVFEDLCSWYCQHIESCAVLRNTSAANMLCFERNFVLKVANSQQHHWLESEKSSSGEGTEIDLCNYE